MNLQGWQVLTSGIIGGAVGSFAPLILFWSQTRRDKQKELESVSKDLSFNTSLLSSLTHKRYRDTISFCISNAEHKQAPNDEQKKFDYQTRFNQYRIQETQFDEAKAKVSQILLDFSLKTNYPLKQEWNDNLISYRFQPIDDFSLLQPDNLLQADHLQLMTDFVADHQARFIVTMQQMLSEIGQRVNPKRKTIQWQIKNFFKTIPIFKMKNKRYYILGAVILLFVFTNPTPSDFRNYLGIGYQTKISRAANILLFSIYEKDSRSYIGILKNFFHFNSKQERDLIDAAHEKAVQDSITDEWLKNQYRKEKWDKYLDEDYKAYAIGRDTFDVSAKYRPAFLKVHPNAMKLWEPPPRASILIMEGEPPSKFIKWTPTYEENLPTLDELNEGLQK
jgi:hypothetical protein